MRGFLICGLIVVATIDSVKSFCTDVSHNECSDDGQEPDFLGRDICQKICQTLNEIGECNFYRFALPVEGNTNCYHYAFPISSYINGCNEISAPRNVDESCLNPQPYSCYVTQSSACRQDMSSILEIYEGSQTQETCRKLCNIGQRCQRWIFYKESESCVHLANADQECDEVFGPPNKTPQECGLPFTRHSGQTPTEDKFIL